MKRNIIYSCLYKSGMKKLYLTGVFLPILFSLALAGLSELFPTLLPLDEDSSIFTSFNDSPFFFVFSAVVIAPSCETLIQYLPLVCSRKFFKKYKRADCCFIVLSALIFASLHEWEVMCFLRMFFVGLTWAYLCFVLMRRKEYPYWNVMLIHSLYNLVPLSFALIAKLFI